jgi:outer membrane protein
MHTFIPSGLKAALSMTVALAAIVAPAAAAQDAGGPTLTVEAAVASAREHNPEMQATRNDAITARATERAARADFLPSAQVQAGMGYTAPGVQRVGAVEFGSSPDYYSSSYQLGVGYTMSGAKLMQPSIARAQALATDRRILSSEAQLVSQVTQQYLTALQAREQAQQAEREVERAQEHQRLAQARLEVGAGTPLDLRRAQVQLGQAEVQQVVRANAYQTELLRLGRLMGRDVPEDVVLNSEFALTAPSWSAAALVEAAVENNPGIQALRAQSGAASSQVRAARSAYLPTMNFNMGVTGSVYSAGNLDPLVERRLEQMQISYGGCLQQNQILAAVGMQPSDCSPLNAQDPAVQARVRQDVSAANPAFPFGFQRQPVSASLTFSLPLFDGLNRERRIEEARVSASNAQLQVRGEEQRLATEVRSMVLALQTAFRTAELQRKVAENASEELRMAQERFRFGLANSIEVTDAQANLAEAERAVIDAVYTYHSALAGLEALVGGSLRQH